jgi:hypothetical protein
MEEEEGYPTDEALEKVSAWDAHDPMGLWNHIEGYFNRHGSAWIEGEDYKLATGGWSGCESVISALEKNWILNALYWQSSHRGGLHVYSFGKPFGE